MSADRDWWELERRPWPSTDEGPRQPFWTRGPCGHLVVQKLDGTLASCIDCQLGRDRKTA